VAETTCAYCGAEVEQLDAVEQDGLAFCSEECADEYTEDDEHDDEEDEGEDEGEEGDAEE
jgi:hypothetical protein